MTVKRVFDLVIAGLLLVLLAAPMLVVALVVRFRLGSPVIYRSQRPGRDGKSFTMYKFRTMSDQRDAQGKLLPDDKRLGAFGRFLRASSLDELPELVNVLQGHMSLVGPRPLLPEYLDRYSAHQARRHEVKPGITGLAQVSGRNAQAWEDRLELDVWYVDNRSLMMDIRILLATIAKVVKREGISASGHATMPEFEGTDHS